MKGFFDRLAENYNFKSPKDFIVGLRDHRISNIEKKGQKASVYKLEAKNSQWMS